MIGTYNNVERTGNRNDLTVSSILREIPGVRHIDVDFVQYHPVTHEREILIEATSAHYKKTDLLQQWALEDKAFAILIKHAHSDFDHTQPVKLTVWDDAGICIQKEYETDWADFKQWCSDIHDAYEESYRAKREVGK